MKLQAVGKTCSSHWLVSNWNVSRIFEHGHISVNAPNRQYYYGPSIQCSTLGLRAACGLPACHGSPLTEHGFHQPLPGTCAEVLSCGIFTCSFCSHRPVASAGRGWRAPTHAWRYCARAGIPCASCWALRRSWEEGWKQSVMAGSLSSPPGSCD